jgi:tartrate dehydrogenase/decarboxylase / D-malate dehydrogenase
VGRPRVLKIGLAVGGGTGPEIAAAFECALTALSSDGHQLIRSPRLYATYAEVAHDRASAQAAARVAAEDAAEYERFLLGLPRLGCRLLFRTAFNAQSLYAARERLLAAKVETLPLPARGELMLVRDEAQGFYAGVNDEPGASPDSIARVCRFSKAVTERLIDFALAGARERWAAAPDRFVLAYKFHVLDNRFARWVFSHARRRRVAVELYQPDTMNRELLRGSLRGRVLILGSNEWLDVMHADLLARHGGFAQDERFTRNVYLDARLRGLVEYQTVHGSADDLAGRGLVNPLAALRSAAAILEEGGVAGAAARMEAAISRVKTRGSTRRTVDGVLAALRGPARSGSAR